MKCKSRKMAYDVDDTMSTGRIFITTCPYMENVRIGSMECITRCIFYMGNIFNTCKKQYVECGYNLGDNLKKCETCSKIMPESYLEYGECLLCINMKDEVKEEVFK